MSVSGEVYIVLARGYEREDIWCAGVTRSKEAAETLAIEQARAVRAQGIETDRYWVVGPRKVSDE